MLAIYLHHDHSVLTNVFCTQALCADSVVSFLSANFVTFGWVIYLIQIPSPSASIVDN